MLWGATADGNCVGVIRLRGMMQLSDLRTKYRNLNTRKRKIVSTLAYDSKRSFWAMADQGVLSLGNFGVSILLAACFERKHDLSDFGAYWILMELMMFLNGIQNALVAYPLTVRGAIADRLQLGRLTSMSMLLTGVMWPLQAAAIVTTAAIAKIPMSVGIWAAIALFLWQMQETLRRGLMAHLKFRESLLGDSISYIGQLVAVALLGWYGMLTLTTAFQAIALTSGLAALVQGAQLGLHNITLPELREFTQDCWDIGRWVLYGNLSRFFTGPMYNWNIAYWAGKDLLGVYYAVMNLLRLANPLTFGIASLITPSAARANKLEGMKGAKRELHRFGLLGAVMLAPYLGMLLIAPKLSISLVYGADSAYLRYSILPQLAAVAAAFTYWATATGAFLGGLERSRNLFISQFAYAGAAVIIAMPLVAGFGLLGAAIGWLVAASIQAAVNIYYVSKLPDSPAPKPADSLDANLRLKAA